MQSWGPTSWFIESRLLIVSSYGRRKMRELSGVISIRALIPFMRTPPSWPNCFLKILTSHCGLRFNLWLSGERWEKEMATYSSILAWRIPRMRRLLGHSPWGHKELDMTEWLTHTFGKNTNFQFTAPRNLLEMQICWPHLGPIKSETLIVGPVILLISPTSDLMPTKVWVSIQ